MFHNVILPTLNDKSELCVFKWQIFYADKLYKASSLLEWILTQTMRGV